MSAVTLPDGSSIVTGTAAPFRAAGVAIQLGPTIDASGAVFSNLARNPDLIASGAITRDVNGAATSAAVVWPDGQPGTYTALVLSTAFLGAVDSYQITYGSPVTRTYTQPTVTRNASGAPVTVPSIVVT